MSLQARYAYLLFPLTFPLGLSAQEDAATTPMLGSGVEELLSGTTGDLIESGTRTELADHRDQEIRETTGVLYVLSAEEIRMANCRDLEEALLLIPSFAIGRDVDDVAGFGIRGQWAQEGKCLFQLNGQPLNESSYGIFAMGARFPLENISRIEVINGPGSVIHGGSAAMGVVNIVTKDLRDEEGMTFSTSTAITDRTPVMQRAHLFGTQRMGTTSELDFSTSINTGPRFTGQGCGPDGTVLSYTDSTRTQTLNGTLRFRRQNFQGQFFVSDHNMQVSDMPYDLVMRTVMGSGEQRFTLGKLHRLDVGLMHRTQLPWFYGNGASYELNATNTMDQRTQASAVFSSEPREWLDITLGTQSWLDRFMMYVPREGNVFAINGRTRLSIWDAALFGEARVRTRFGALVAGARSEHHSLSGTATAPRFGYIGVFKAFHVKLLYSAAFKVPTMQNINVGPEDGGIRREQVWTREVELGYRFSMNTEVTAVAFHTLITDPIVYVYQGDTGAQDSYLNRSASGTQGLEGHFRHWGKKAGVRLGISCYAVDRTRTDLPETMLPDSLGDAFQALPRLKATIITHWRLTDRDRVGVSGIWCGGSYSYSNTANGELSLQRHAPWLRAGITVERSFRRLEGLNASVGCLNILDQRAFIQSPYSNGLPSLPMNGREFTFRVEYRFAL
jgi:outer membrane receptor for ferrienterochelin and colicin